MQLNLVDEFGTVVAGEIIETGLFAVVLSAVNKTGCEIIEAPKLYFNATTGIASVPQLQILTFNNQSCQLQFTILASTYFEIPPLFCTVRSYGCPDHYKVISHSSYDYCGRSYLFPFPLFLLSPFLLSFSFSSLFSSPSRFPSTLLARGTGTSSSGNLPSCLLLPLSL